MNRRHRKYRLFCCSGAFWAEMLCGFDLIFQILTGDLCYCFRLLRLIFLFIGCLLLQFGGALLLSFSVWGVFFLVLPVFLVPICFLLKCDRSFSPCVFSRVRFPTCYVSRVSCYQSCPKESRYLHSPCVFKSTCCLCLRQVLVRIILCPLMFSSVYFTLGSGAWFFNSAADLWKLVALLDWLTVVSTVDCSGPVRVSNLNKPDCTDAAWTVCIQALSSSLQGRRHEATSSFHPSLLQSTCPASRMMCQTTKKRFMEHGRDLKAWVWRLNILRFHSNDTHQ